MIHFFNSHDGTCIAYRDEGSGVPVLCLSGLTRNSSDFDYLAPHLSGIRLIRMDYRGRGASAWTDPATYTIPVEAGDALALLDHLGIDQAAVIGTSRGGMISMHLAAVAKARLRAVCLVDIGPELAAEGLALIKGYIGKNPATSSMPDLACARARLYPGFEGVPDSRWMEEVQKHFVETEDGITINYDPDLARIFDVPAVDVDLWPLFDALSGLPLALIRGATSDLLTAETASKMRRRRPDMIFAEVPGRGHVPFLDEPEALGAIHKWLEALT